MPCWRKSTPPPNEQQSGIAQINHAIADLDAITQQNAALVEQVTAAALALRTQAGNVRNTMRLLRLSSAEAALSPGVRRLEPVHRLSMEPASQQKAHTTLRATSPAAPKSSRQLGRPDRPIAAEVQAAAFVAHLGAAHDQLGHLHQVAQLQQVARDVEVGVELLDFALQQGDAVGGPLQALRWCALCPRNPT